MSEGTAGTTRRRVEILAAFDARYRDFDMMAESAIAWDQEYDHIGRGNFEGSLTQVVLTTMQAGRVGWKPGIMQRGAAPGHSWVIGLPIVAEGTLHARGRPIAVGQPVLIGPCEDMAFIANGATDIALAVIPVGQIERWMQVRRGAPGLDRKCLDRPWTMNQREIVERGTALATLLDALVKNQNGIEPNAVAVIEGQIVDVVLGMVPSTDVAEPLHRRARIALKLRDMLEANVETPCSVGAICDALGVRERTLYLACMEAFGRPPKALLLELRLNHVRRALAHPDLDKTVTAVAARFGFWHFGHFSAEYKRQFGELPSSTLTNALGKAAYQSSTE
ncbi:AraC family transcriptional regulator, ethanolamine operon transcriptional activator [Mesorhizobium albiziae]|uniref:AraC family transcriptional regulator, ethanolamine operon transcriptional activator n=1 Tax=Neomesorhizobium albiziae TaxID=335020 RepID=A0A1I4CYT9_9HYPH|nr:helix-turn-helix domain-containing protein [Mesorhizobium albiziae]GLS28393.1 AraC family transcriptional regulator [Mesorhizobium albiziae]SFK86488.1 AraC family transcriptional regulator, ethanolamine operon transcriptional activator [Mesorhizobium albiziae]